MNNQRPQKRPAQKSELSAKANKLFSQLIDLGQTQEDIAAYVKDFMNKKGLEKSTEAKTAAMEQMKNDILKSKENR